MDLLTIFAASVMLAVPGRTSSTPTVAAEGRFVAIAWTATAPDGSADAYVAVSRDDASSFGAPVRANDVAGSVRANGEQPPRIVLSRRPSGDPTITVLWTAKGRSGTKLMWTRSADGGRTFVPTASVPDTDMPGNRGWHNAAADAGGGVVALWLDHRELASDGSVAATHHQHGAGDAPDGVALAQRSKLFFASLDGRTAPIAVTGGVCYCCKTALATAADGVVYAAWRHVYAGNFRDIAFTMSRDGGRTFAAPLRVSEDGWMLEGCPDDGPAMAVDSRRTIHVVWPTLVGGDESGDQTIAIFHAASSHGRRFGRRRRLPTEGIAHHPQAAVDGRGELFVAWDETIDGRRRVVIARGSGTETAISRSIVSGDERAAVYPSLAGLSRGAVIVWTSRTGETSGIRVARVR